MADLRLEGVAKSFGAKDAVSDLSIAVKDGELFAVLGPSGCGKTTALRIVAGFVLPDRGRVLFGERDVTRLAPEKRDAAMVFQSYALFPHLDVGENVAFGLRARPQSSAHDIPARVASALALVDLKGYERREVGNLSGGEQQRVALARAIVVEPKLLLLDEPMSNLDPKLREGTRKDLRRLQQRLGITTLYVTHDQQEALEMADRVAVMHGGRLVQVGSPRELYDRPASEFVATFLGHANLIEAVVARVDGDDALLEIPGGSTLRAAAAGAKAGESVRLAVRPESLIVGEPAGGGPGDVQAIGEGLLRAVEFQGPTVDLLVELAPGIVLRATRLNHGDDVGPVGSRVRLAARRDRLVLLRRE